jgi:hypothetical protein
MTVFDLFSKRQARQRGETPDIYTYDQIPNKLRVQLVQIIGDLLQGGDDSAARFHPGVGKLFEFISNTLCREYGIFRLWGKSHHDRDHRRELFNFMLETTDHERVLDCVELATRCADRLTRNFGYLDTYGFDERVDDGIAELNTRFKEHGVGFQYEDGDLVRIDSDLLHAEAVKPALQLLRTKKFAGPREEFLRAYEHFRHARHEEALTEALKAFESTMKAICDAKNWAYDKNATAKKLVDACFKNGLIDPFWQTHMAHLQGTLENGIATARNKLGGHGAGATPREVPQALVAYVLHLTAATIVFLIESA